MKETKIDKDYFENKIHKKKKKKNLEGKYYNNP
jgi:hypothetical protein